MSEFFCAKRSQTLLCFQAFKFLSVERSQTFLLAQRVAGNPLPGCVFFAVHGRKPVLSPAAPPPESKGRIKANARSFPHLPHPEPPLSARGGVSQGHRVSLPVALPGRSGDGRRCDQARDSECDRRGRACGPPQDDVGAGGAACGTAWRQRRSGGVYRYGAWRPSPGLLRRPPSPARGRGHRW